MQYHHFSSYYLIFINAFQLTCCFIFVFSIVFSTFSLDSYILFYFPHLIRNLTKRYILCWLNSHALEHYSACDMIRLVWVGKWPNSILSSGLSLSSLRVKWQSNSRKTIFLDNRTNFWIRISFYPLFFFHTLYHYMGRACKMVHLSNATHDNYFDVREINKLFTFP
jgi:hypothetical protein